MAQRILKLLNTMSGKFQKFNFRKFVFKKKKDRKYSQESIHYTKSNDKTMSKTGCHQRQSNWSDGDISLRRRGSVVDGVTSASGNRYEPKLDNLSGSKKGVNIHGVGLVNAFSSVEGLKKLPKRRSKTQEPKPSPVMNEPYSNVDSMSRNMKEATWGVANTSPFFYHKSVSTPCMTVKKTVQQSSGFDGMAIGWPSLRTWDVPGAKARFSATGVAPVYVPGNNTKIDDISPSWSNMAQAVPKNIPPLSSDSRTAITNRAKKLYALKLITGEIWNPEPNNIPYFIEQELSDNSKTIRLNSIIIQRPESQKDFFQDKARKSLVDTVKKVVGSHQPVSQTMKLKPQANLDTDKKFYKHIRAPSVEPSGAYSDNNKLYYGKMKTAEQNAPHYRPLEQQLDNISKVPLNPVPGIGNVPEPTNLYLTKMKNLEHKVPFYRPLVPQLDIGLNIRKIPNDSAPNLVNMPHANNLHSEQKVPHFRPLMQQSDNNLNFSKAADKPMQNVRNEPHTNNLHVTNMKYSEQKVPLPRPLVQQSENSLNLNKAADKPVQNVRNEPHTNNLHVTNMKYSEQKVPLPRPLVQQSENSLNLNKAADKPVQNVRNEPHTNNLHVTNMKYSEQKVPLPRPLVQQSENSLNLNKTADKPVQNVRNVPQTKNLYLTKMKNSEQTVPRYRFQVQKLENELNVKKVADNPEPNHGNVSDFAMANTRPNLKVAKSQQKNTTKLSDSKPPFFEKVPHNDAWHIRKVSDFVWQKLKQMTEIASSNFKQAAFTSRENLEKNDSSTKTNAKEASDDAEHKLKSVSDVKNVEHNLDLEGTDLENVTEFARPIPKHFPEYVEIPRNLPASARPYQKNMLKFSYANFEKEQGFAWSKINKLSKFDDPNLKTFGATETTIKKFPYFEVVNIKKEYDFELPNTKKNFDFVFTNMGNQLKLSQTTDEKESDFTKSNGLITTVGSEEAPTSARTKLKKGFDSAGPEPESAKPIPATAPVLTEVTHHGFLPNQGDGNRPALNDKAKPIPATAPVLTEVTHHGFLPNQGDQNRPALNDKEGSKPTLAKTTQITESKHEQAHVLSEPKSAKVRKFAEYKKQPEFVKQILHPATKIESLADSGETDAVQEPDVSKLILETKPDLVRQNPEHASEHSEPNLSQGSEFTKRKTESAISGWQSKTTPALGGTKVENVPDSDRPNIKKLPVELNSNNSSSISPKSNFVTLNQFASAESGKDNSAVNILHDTTTQITVNVKSETDNNLPKHLDEIGEKTPDSRKQEVQTSWKIYVIHNAQGKESNPASIKQQKTNDTAVITKPPIYSSESQYGKTWKKMNSMSHNPPSTSYGCTESLITTRILKSANLQNYPPPKMFNQVGRGENKFLVFWKGREDTNIFTNQNKKQPLLMTPQSPRRTFPSGSVSPRKAVAEYQTSEDDSIARTKKSSSAKLDKSIACMPSQDSVSNFLPVVCVPLETLPCVVSSSDAGLQDDVLENNK